MIVKHVPMRSRGKSDFAGLANYITDAQSKDHRLAAVQVTNCAAATLGPAIWEILATQHLNTRAKGDKTYHLIVSFAAGERPAAEVLQEIEARMCSSLGYAEHQRISVVHDDTDNLHIHIAINKIHPERLTLHEPFKSYRTLAEVAVELEKEYRLQAVNHASRRTQAEGRAADMERHAGIESLVGWIRRECLDDLTAAQTWQELHQILRDNDLELRPRANGFVIEAGDGTQVKASTVDRGLSKPSLEARFGTFEASPRMRTPAKRKYDKSPVRMRVNTTELYAQYKAAQQSLTAHRGDALDAARNRKQKAIEAAERRDRMRRAVIKLIGKGRTEKKLLYAQANSALRATVQEANSVYAKEKAAIYDAQPRRTWVDWLKHEAQQGRVDALSALRAREAAQGLQGNTIKGTGAMQHGAASQVDTITKNGTIIFRAGKNAVRDDGDRLQVSREVPREGLQTALSLAMQRYGNHITVTGSVEFKAQLVKAAVELALPITFADPVMENRRLAEAAKARTKERRGLPPGKQRPPSHGNQDIRTLSQLTSLRIDSEPVRRTLNIPVAGARGMEDYVSRSELQRRDAKLRAESVTKAARRNETKARGI